MSSGCPSSNESIGFKTCGTTGTEARDCSHCNFLNLTSCLAKISIQPNRWLKESVETVRMRIRGIEVYQLLVSESAHCTGRVFRNTNRKTQRSSSKIGSAITYCRNSLPSIMTRKD